MGCIYLRAAGLKKTGPYFEKAKIMLCVYPNCMHSKPLLLTLFSIRYMFVKHIFCENAVYIHMTLIKNYKLQINYR